MEQLKHDVVELRSEVKQYSLQVNTLTEQVKGYTEQAHEDALRVVKAETKNNWLLFVATFILLCLVLVLLLVAGPRIYSIETSSRLTLEHSDAIVANQEAILAAQREQIGTLKEVAKARDDDRKANIATQLMLRRVMERQRLLDESIKKLIENKE